ncbi:MAG: FHA domain-containing protein [Planctomycetota bacterium]
MPALVTANAVRFELEHNRSYVLGRAADSDIIVGDAACSRQHAKITLGAEERRSLFIEDLGSRNGTYVNEERIWGRTAVKDGCSIRIGATVYVLLMHDEEREMDSHTVAIEKFSLGMDIDDDMLRVMRSRGTESAHFAGKLETFSLIDVLQLFCHNQSSGTLHVVVSAGDGTIEIRRGEICQAHFQELDGFHALVLLARQKTGRFWLVENKKPCRKAFQKSTPQLLVEVCCTIDEAKATK